MSDARRFIDRYGFSWQVCELWSTVDRPEAPRLADRAAPDPEGWLYFFSRGTTLVLREYPAGWEELGWMELERLLERADVLGSDAALSRRPHASLGMSRARPSALGSSPAP